MSLQVAETGDLDGANWLPDAFNRIIVYRRHLPQGSNRRRVQYCRPPVPFGPREHPPRDPMACAPTSIQVHVCLAGASPAIQAASSPRPLADVLHTGPQRCPTFEQYVSPHIIRTIQFHSWPPLDSANVSPASPSSPRAITAASFRFPHLFPLLACACPVHDDQHPPITPPLGIVATSPLFVLTFAPKSNHPAPPLVHHCSSTVQSSPTSLSVLAAREARCPAAKGSFVVSLFAFCFAFSVLARFVARVSPRFCSLAYCLTRAHHRISSVRLLCGVACFFN